MHYVSLQAAITLTGWSERTLRRRLADGALQSSSDNKSYKTMISFDSIRADLCIPVEGETIELIEKADAGSAAAQNDLAVLFMENHQPKSAVYWLELAAKQGFADAMHWLGCCYLKGLGVPEDDNLAIMWIAKAASLGHSIAASQIQSIRPPYQG
jgi:TPR repeat protein